MLADKQRLKSRTKAAKEYGFAFERLRNIAA